MKKSLNRTLVFEAAQALVKQGRIPTQDSVRQYLGRGSRGTIHKYLQQWKQACFENSSQGLEQSQEPASGWIEAKLSLEQALEKQIQLNKVLSQDLLQTERELARLREQANLQQKQLTDWQAVQQRREAESEKIKTAYEAVCMERETAIQHVIEDKNRLIEKLRIELKAVYEENLKQIQEWSFKKEDQLLQEKVKCLNYEEQFKRLKEERGKQAAELLALRQQIVALKRQSALFDQKAIQLEMDAEREQ